MYVVVRRPAKGAGETYERGDQVLAGSNLSAFDTRALYEALKERFEPEVRTVTITNVFNDLPPDPAYPQEPAEADESPVSLADEVMADLADELREIGVEPAEGYPKLATFADERAAALYARVLAREDVLDQIDGHICAVVGERRVEAFQRLIDREAHIMDSEDDDGFGR